MSNQRYTLESKDEAARQIVERGYSVVDVSERLGVSAHSRYKWIMTMCRVLNVCRSGYYAWLHKPLSDRAIEDQRLLVLVRASYAASSGVYGAPRVFLDLREAEVRGAFRMLRELAETGTFREIVKSVEGFERGRRLILDPGGLDKWLNTPTASLEVP